MGLIKKLRKAKKEAPPNEKPAVVKTHLRDMIIVPEMIGSVVGIYNGKVRSFDCSHLDHVFLWQRSGRLLKEHVGLGGNDWTRVADCVLGCRSSTVLRSSPK